MTERFPSPGFFRALAAAVPRDRELVRLGFFDTTFGLRILRDDGRSGVLVVLSFDANDLRDVREVDGDVPAGVDFVLEAPYAVWRDLLEHPATHTINSLTHHGTPMKVIAPDPLGHDKLFRFQESVQRVFELASTIERA